MTSGEGHILQAHWLGPRTGCFLLEWNWEEAELPRVRLETAGLEVVNVRRAPGAFLGGFLGYREREDGWIVFSQEARRHPQVEAEVNPVRVAGPFNDWGKQDVEGWRLRPVRGEGGGVFWECAVERQRLGGGHHAVPFKFVTADWQWLEVLFCAPNRVVDHAGNANYQWLPGRTGRHVFLFDVVGGRPLTGRHTLVWAGGGRRPGVWVRPGLAFYDLATAAPLGARVVGPQGPGEEGATEFRVFAPRATSVAVELFPQLEGGEVARVELQLEADELTWMGRVPGNRAGWYYYLRVAGDNDGLTTRFHSEQRILDPWALATVGATGPGIVVAEERVRPVPAEAVYQPPAWSDLVIVEAHVRDLTARAPVAMALGERQGFRGLARWLEAEGSYPASLGVNALELLPVHQFDTPTREEYHWGYMTTNFFSPCAHYAQEPERGSQIEEFRAVVEACHRRGLAVILDVVYNHAGEPPHLMFLDKDYFFHLEADGAPSNWSGTGNTIKAESAMAKRLILDSLRHYVRVFDVDGFRFDLAELLTAETLKEIELALKAVKPGIVLVAEPWSFRGHIAWRLRSVGMAWWNDGFREFVSQYVRGHGTAEGLRYFMKGSVDHLAAFPSQSVNYVASHDDRCWIDKITENPRHDGRQPTGNDIHRTHLMLAIQFCAIGMPMLAAGMDFLQSKGGRNNTYLEGEVNALDYGRGETFRTTQEYCRRWIAFRQSVWGELVRLREKPGPGYLRLYGAEGKASAALLFNADGSRGSRQILFAVNPHFDQAVFRLEGMGWDGWLELADRNTLQWHALGQGRLSPEGRVLRIGPLDVGLWVRG